MKVNKIVGKNKGEVTLYALSICVWCKKTKKLLNEMGVEYGFVDVDLCDDSGREEAESVLKKWNPSGSFPTMIINNDSCIAGYAPEAIKEKLK